MSRLTYAELTAKYENLKAHLEQLQDAQARRVEGMKAEMQALRKALAKRQALEAKAEALEHEVNRLDNINIVIDRDRQFYQRLYEARLFRERSASCVGSR